jgi:hypothetical protein
MDSRLSDGTLSGYAQKRIDDYPFDVLIPRHYLADSFINHSITTRGTYVHWLASHKHNRL